MYPVFLRFQGGKGVSTALGVLLALDPWLAAGAVATWLIIAFFFRISSLAALVAAVFAPFFAFLLYGMSRFALEPAVGVTVIALLIVGATGPTSATCWRGPRAGSGGRRRTSGRRTRLWAAATRSSQIPARADRRNRR